MMVYEKIYFEAYTSGQYIWHKYKTAQLYFILGNVWIFPVDLDMPLIFIDFQ